MNPNEILETVKMIWPEGSRPYPEALDSDGRAVDILFDNGEWEKYEIVYLMYLKDRKLVTIDAAHSARGKA